MLGGFLTVKATKRLLSIEVYFDLHQYETYRTL